MLLCINTIQLGTYTKVSSVEQVVFSLMMLLNEEGKMTVAKI